MSAPHHLRLQVPADADATDILTGSLGPEALDLKDDRSRVRIERTDEGVLIDIEAKDLIALRAAANTWMGLLGTAERALALAGERY